MMTSTIRTNMDAVRAHNIFSSNNARMAKAFTNVSTGMRLNSVQDGPSDWAVSEKMRERINSLNQANRNIQNDTAMMKTAEGGITNTIDILRTLKARVINAADASTSDTDRTVIAKELKNLLDQVEYNATTVKYNGISLLQNDSAGGETPTSRESETAVEGAYLRFQIGDEHGSNFNVTLEDMSLKGLGLDSITSILAGKTTDDLSTQFSSMIPAGETETPDYAVLLLKPAPDESSETAVTTPNITAPANARDLVGVLDEALNKALASATTVGSLENRLGYTADNVTTQIENLQASDSAIRDSDMAHEVSEYMKWSVLSQASQYMLAQSNQNAFSVLNLLQ